MRAPVHILVGVGLGALAAGSAWLAVHVERAPDAKLPMKVIRVVTLGSDRSRSDWLRRLRVAYGGMGCVLAVGAIALWATA